MTCQKDLESYLNMCADDMKIMREVCCSGLQHPTMRPKQAPALVGYMVDEI